MSREEVLKIWPNASESTIRRNAHLPDCVFKTAVAIMKNKAEEIRGLQVKMHPEIEYRNSWKIVISGQIKGGKNNMIVTSTGLHFPKPEWAKWRNQAVEQVKAQLPVSWMPLCVPTNIRLEYIAGDKRRRDMPAIIDSIFHVFEKAGVCVDDTLLWVSESSRGYDKEKPRAVVTFLS